MWKNMVTMNNKSSISILFAQILASVFLISCEKSSEQSKPLTSEVTNRDEVTDHDSIKKLELLEFQQKELLNQVFQNPININEIIKDDNVFRNFIICPNSIASEYFLPDGYEIGLHTFSFVRHDSIGLKQSLPYGRIFVARPISKKPWQLVNDNEVIISVELYNKALSIGNTFRVGLTESDVKKKIGNPNYDNGDTLVYLGNRSSKFQECLEFQIESDTVRFLRLYKKKS
jgi:hypothetical protein